MIGRRHGATQRNPWQLTSREFHTVELITAGRSSGEIIKIMSISRDTFQARLSAIFLKMGVYDRVGLVLAVLHHPEARAACFPGLAIQEQDR